MQMTATRTQRKFYKAMSKLWPPDWLGCIFLYIINVCILRRTIVVLERLGGVGDMLCLLTVVPGLRRRHKNSWIVFVCPSGCKHLAQTVKLCNAICEKNSFFHLFVQNVCDHSTYYAPVLRDENNNEMKQPSEHLATQFAEIIGVEVDFDALKIEIPISAKKRVRKILSLKLVDESKGIIIFHAGPTWLVREWPADFWHDLINSLQSKKSYIIVQIGTDLVSDRSERRRMLFSDEVINLTNELSLVETAALLEKADVFVGIDSGPIHLATILGVPTLGLFGPTVGTLRVHPRAVSEIVPSISKCLGCHSSNSDIYHWRSGCPNDIACMKGISADEVINSFNKLINDT